MYLLNKVNFQKEVLPLKEKSEPKELAPEIPTPKTQADLGVGTDTNPNIGSGDLNKP